MSVKAKGAHYLSKLENIGNSSVIPLGASEAFNGIWESVIDFTTVSVSALSTNPTDGILYFDKSLDGGVTYTTTEYEVADARFFEPITRNVTGSHVRIRYENGATPMTGTFNLQTKFSNWQTPDADTTNPNPISKPNGEETLAVSDMNNNTVLCAIAKTLEKIELHLSIMTGEERL